jgi:DNA-binding transcriptional MerR regulator
MSKLYYSIGEVSDLIEVKPYIIRYWETEFSQLKSKNSRSRNRRYTQKDIDLLQRIKSLIYDHKYTLEGAKKAVQEESVQQKQIKIRIEQTDSIPVKREELRSQLIQIKQLLLER